MGIDLALDRVNVLNGGEVEIAPPDERPEMLEEALARLAVAGGDAGLDHGGALPVLAEALVVDLRRLDRERHRRRRGIGPEAEIGAEDVTFGRALFEDAHDLPSKPDEPGLQIVDFGIGGDAGLVEHDEIDVGRISDLMRAELAHGEHEESRALARPLGRRKLEATGPMA